MRLLMMKSLGRVFAIGLFTLLGCDAPQAEESEELATTTTSAVQAPSSEEPTWEEAVAAVRNGDSDEIRLHEVPVTDSQLADLSGLNGLIRLNLPRSEITDAGLRTITTTVPDLELLWLGSSAVTDEGMQAISQLKKLRFLKLINVPITDAGLQPLHEMTWLESFYLEGGNATDQGLSELIKALPELHFHRNQHHLPGDPKQDGH